MWWRRHVLRALVAGVAATTSACSVNPYPGEEGAVLHVSLRSLPKTLDAPRVEQESSSKLVANVYEGLLQYHPYARPYQVQPALAQALPEVSEDGTTYTFRLRPGVRYHTDPCVDPERTVDAHDVEYAFKRFLHPTTQARSLWLLRDKLLGLAQWREAMSDHVARARERGEPAGLHGLDELDIAGVRVVDDLTLQLVMERPYPQLYWVLAMPQLSVYPRECVDYYDEAFASHPVGTGPFRVTSYNPVFGASMVRHERYREVRVPDPAERPADRYPGWEEDLERGLLDRAGERIPFLDGMEFRFILEDQPRWLYFKNGYTDFVNPPKDNTAEALPLGDLSEQMVDRGVRVQRWTELGTVYACLNTEDELLSNVDVRRAVALAYDHRWTVDNLYAGQALVARSLIPPGVAGHDPSYHPFHSEDGTADVQAAREQLARAGYPEGIDPETGQPLRITFQSSGSSVTNRAFAARFTDEMRRIGIEVDVVVNTFPQMVEKMRNKEFQIASLAWGFDYPDAQNILQLLYGPNKAPGVGSANFDHPEFDALYDQAAVMAPGPERTELYVRMAHIVADEVPWVTRTHRIRPNLGHQWVGGYKYTEVNDQHLNYVWVDDALRDRLVAEWNRPRLWPLPVLGLAVVLLVGISALRTQP
ncbi:MAG: hypothetical protein KTR31_05365 [Myxococcales bacterium]|nr:hypothetical protein [Myxococcales bacterium]